MSFLFSFFFLMESITL